MAQTLIKNNPSFQSDEDLIRSFVVRQELLEFILEVIDENTDRPNEPPHHVLIVGPRGSGKTTLVHRVAAEIRSQPAHYGAWYPITFSEESYNVSSPGEFWLEAIFHLADQTGDTRWQAVHDELRGERDEKRLNDRALSQLSQFSVECGKRLLIVAENLNMLLGEQMTQNDGWTLRHTLQSAPEIMLLGTATVRFQEIDNIDKAWFELLAVRTLDPLGEAQCGSLWQSVAQRKLGPRHLRAIEILTGGNPRLIKILAGFFVDRSFRELMDQLVRLIDDHTEYFKSLLDGLSAQERKVFSALLDAWDPISAKSLADATRLSASQVSALLSRLVSRGAVLANSESPRRKTYQAAERLFNIYYLMRRRGHPANRVRAVVDLMVEFYDAPDLLLATRKIAEELRNASSDDRDDYSALFQGVYKRMSEPQQRRELIRCIGEEVFGRSGLPPGLKPLWDDSRYDSPNLHMPAPLSSGVRGSLVRGLWERACDALARPFGGRDEECIRRLIGDCSAIPHRPWQLTAVLGECLAEMGDTDAARREFDDALTSAPKDEWTRAHLAKLEMDSGNLGEAERVLRSILSEHATYGWAGRLLAEVLLKTERVGEAERVLRTILDSDELDADAHAALASLLHGQPGRFEESEGEYRKATSIDPEYAWAWAHLGDLLHEKLCHYSEAEEAYRKAIAINSGDGWAWAQLGELLHEKLGRYVEAEDAYRKATSCAPGYSWPWIQLGNLLHEQLERNGEAEEAYRKSISIAPDSSWPWVSLGQFYEKLARYSDAEGAYLKSISLEPSAKWPWFHLGTLLSERLKLYDRAEAAFRQAAEIDPGAAWIWAKLGALLHEKLDRFAEAEEAYRRAVSIDTNYGWAWAQLGELLHEKLGRYVEAEDAYRKATSLAPDYAWPWVQLGDLLHEKLSRDREAEEAYRKALLIDSDYALAWGQLGQLLESAPNRHAEAEEAYRKAVLIDPNYAWAWGQLAELLREKPDSDAESVEAYRRAISIEPNFAWPWLRLGDLLAERLHRYVEAEDAYRHALSADPKSASTWQRLGVLLQKQPDRRDEAESAYRIALISEDCDFCSTWFYIGLLLDSQKARRDEAQEAYKASIAAAIEHTVSDAWSRLAVLSLDTGDRLEALSAFSNAAKAWIAEFRGGKSRPGSYEFAVTFSHAVAGGRGSALLRSIEGSDVAPSAEPITTALRIIAGEKPQVAAEILEIAKDISKVILKGVRRLRDEGGHDWLDAAPPIQE